METRLFSRFLAVFFFSTSTVPLVSGEEQAPETSKPELSAEDRAHIEAWHQLYLSAKIARRLPEYVKKADAAALQGNQLMSEGNLRGAQQKFLEALNQLSNSDRHPNWLLYRKEAYAQQLLVAIRAEQRALEQERAKQNEQ